MFSGITDATRRFIIGHGAVRGEYVRLDAAWRAMLARRAYPEPVTSLLGERLAASALFTSTVKMLQDDGRMTLQIQGGKPVSPSWWRSAGPTSQCEPWRGSIRRPRSPRECRCPTSRAAPPSP